MAMTDIFEDWKKSKFIVAPYDLLDRANEQLVILSDYKYWATQEEELDAWCEAYNASRVGMTITFPNEKILTAFILKWQ